MKDGLFPYHWDLTNHLIKTFSIERYLEIGIDQGTCFRKIQAPVKHGVDPNTTSGLVTFPCTSDQFFQNRPAELLYDLIFIDGDHSAEAVARDIDGALKALSPRGVLLLHDTLPHSWESTLSPMGSFTAWQAFAKLRMTRADLSMASVVLNLDTANDTGVGIIFPGQQTLYPEVELDRGVFDDRLVWGALMNVIPQNCAAQFVRPRAGKR